MLTIYHNPNCSKSRAALDLLKNSGQPFEQINYLKQPLGEPALTQLINTLHHDRPQALVRLPEGEKPTTDAAIIAALLAEPKLLQRPLITNGKTTLIGRPTERVEQFLAEL